MPSYIVFHPDRQRVEAKVKADIFRNGEIEKNWTGNVWVDSFAGNEDPWCHSKPWMYSYCHATQIKRSVMKPGDIVFFVSGGAADKGNLQCDTVFVIKEKLEWADQKAPEKLVKKYPKGSDAWERHLLFGDISFKDCEHAGKYTFTAKNFSKDLPAFSYLPLEESGKNVSIPVKELESEVSQKVSRKRKGKYPVELTETEAEKLYKMISKRAKIKIVTIQKVLSEIKKTASGGCGSCSTGKPKRSSCR